MLKKYSRKALTFSGSGVKISKCDVSHITMFIWMSYKNKQSIHSHPAALLAGVQTFDFPDPA